jgi:hypothetical protein
MDWVKAKNSGPDPKRNYTDTCYLQILCLIPCHESSAEAKREIVDLLTDKYGARTCLPPGPPNDAASSGLSKKHEIHPPGVA